MNPPRSTTREDQRKLTRRRIVDAARICFYEQGVAEVAVEQIARIAGVGRATLYLHFPNKDAILLELLSINLVAVRRIFAGLCALDRMDVPAATAWLTGYIDTLRSHRDAMRLVHVGIATTEDARALIHSHHEAVADMIGARFEGVAATEHGRVRLMLLIARTDHLVGTAAEVPPRIDPVIGTALVADELVALLTGRRAPSKSPL